MREILYLPKVTKSTTEYRTISNEDMQWCINQSQLILDVIKSIQGGGHETFKHIHNMLTIPVTGLIKKSSGRLNSVQSLLDGIVDNIKLDTQRDFSNKTCMGLEQCFAIVNALIPEIEDVQFIKGKPKYTLNTKFKQYLDEKMGK